MGEVFILDSKIFLKAGAVWIVIALAEMVHGVIREKALAPRVGGLGSR
jgi:hypothetical protein